MQLRHTLIPAAQNWLLNFAANVVGKNPLSALYPTNRRVTKL